MPTPNNPTGFNPHALDPYANVANNNPFAANTPSSNAYFKANPFELQAYLRDQTIGRDAEGFKVGDVWTSQNAGREELYGGANFTPIGAVNVGPGTWQSGTAPTPTTVTGPPGQALPAITNLGAYGTGDQGGPGTPSGTTTPTPSPLNYLGLPNYANLGSNFTGGTNSDNPFAGLFGGPDQTNFLSNWT